MAWELLAQLFPPVTRFFIGLLLVLTIVGVETLVMYWIFTLYGKDE